MGTICTAKTIAIVWTTRKVLEPAAAGVSEASKFHNPQHLLQHNHQHCISNKHYYERYNVQPNLT